jgi:hypothetical protein
LPEVTDDTSLPMRSPPYLSVAHLFSSLM